MKIGMNEAEKYLRSLKMNETTILVSHNDADGVSSAALMNAFLSKRLRKEADDIIIQTMPPTNSLMMKLNSYVPDKVIITDLSIVDSRVFRKIASISYPLLIDHHTFSEIPDVNAVYLNPRVHNPDAYQSASYLVYKLTSRIVNMEDRLWLAVVGIIGDYDISQSTDLLREARKKMPDITMNINQLMKSECGRVGEMIYSARAYKRVDLSEMARVLSRFSSPSEFLASSEAEKYARITEIIRQEVEKAKEEARHSSEKIGKFVFYELKSRYAIRSFISTMLGDMYPDRIVIITEATNGKVKVSARNQSKKYDVASLLKKASEMVGDGKVGGHPAAAGGVVRKDMWKDFKSALISLV